ncbi:MAG: biotin/lipoyl-binding protein, partial [Psychromonas sp.]
MTASYLSKTMLFSFLIVIISGCDNAKVQPAPPPPAVIVETLAFSEIQPQMSFIGRTQATEDVSIRSQVEGTLLTRHFTGGDDVNKGDLLFEIDPTPYQTAVDQQRAALEHAKSAYQIANNRLERGQRLVKSGSISELEIDELSASTAQTKSDVAIKQAALD